MNYLLLILIFVGLSQAYTVSHSGSCSGFSLQILDGNTTMASVCFRRKSIFGSPCTNIAAGIAQSDCFGNDDKVAVMTVLNDPSYFSPNGSICAVTAGNWHIGKDCA